MEVDDLAWLVFCRGIVLILVATAEVGVAAYLRAAFFDSILDRTSSICSRCQPSTHGRGMLLGQTEQQLVTLWEKYLPVSMNSAYALPQRSV
jgi:hypothetical protein